MEWDLLARTLGYGAQGEGISRITGHPDKPVNVECQNFLFGRNCSLTLMTSPHSPNHLNVKLIPRTSLRAKYVPLDKYVRQNMDFNVPIFHPTRRSSRAPFLLVHIAERNTIPTCFPLLQSYSVLVGPSCWLLG